jgi:hypothetical protein
MIDGRLIVALARELSNVALGSEAARAIASDMEALNAVMNVARVQLQFEHSPHDFARLVAPG